MPRRARPSARPLLRPLSRPLSRLTPLLAPLLAPLALAAPPRPIDASAEWGEGPHALLSQPASLSDGGGWALSLDAATPPAATLEALRPSDAPRAPYALALSAPLLNTYAMGGAAWGGGWAWGQQLQLSPTLRFGAALAYLSDPRDPAWGDALGHREWRLAAGFTYEPSAWLKIGVAWRDLLEDITLKRGPLTLTAALRPLAPFTRHALSTLTLGGAARPRAGGVDWRLSARLPLWRGLGLEGRVEGYAPEGATSAPARPEQTGPTWSAALSWIREWGWRSEVSGGGSRQALALSARLRATPPAPLTPPPAPRLVVVSLRSASEIESTRGLLGDTSTRAPFLSALRALDALRADPSARAVLLTLAAPDLGWAQAEELAKGIRALRASGRRVFAYAPTLTPPTYAAAAAADEIWVTPTTEVGLTGVVSEHLYFKRTLDALGVSADVVAVGEHKIAPELFTRAEPSEAAAAHHAHMVSERARALSAALYPRATLIETRDAARALLEAQADPKASPKADPKATSIAPPPKRLAPRARVNARVEAWISGGPYNAQEALAAGLIDEIVHAVELERHLIKRAGALELHAYEPPQEERWGQRPALAALYVVGEIGQGAGLTGGARVGVSNLMPLIAAVGSDPLVRGVLLRIDSPGGAISDADELWQALSRLAQRKPLVVSMGDLAASGGYYVAAPAHRIFANATTLTGSVGVFGGKVDLSGLLARLGVGHYRYRSAESGGESSPLSPWSAAQRRRVEEALGGLYDLFLSRVTTSRAHLTRDVLLPLAGGRVWTGEEAQARGLVDEVGGLIDALRHLEREAGLASGEYDLRPLAPTTPSALTRALDLIGGRVSDEPALNPLAAPLALTLAALPPPLRALLALIAGHPGEPLAYAPLLDDGGAP